MDKAQVNKINCNLSRITIKCSRASVVTLYLIFFCLHYFFREKDLELYNLASGSGHGHGHVAIVPVPQTTHSTAGPFDDLIEPVKKVQFEIGECPGRI